MDIVEGVLHKGMNQPPSGIFGISGDAGDAAHIHDFVVDIDLHGINNDHGGKAFFIKPSQDISLFQNRSFGVFDLFLLPAGLKQIVGGHLECILEQSIELLQVAFVQFPHSEIAVGFKVNRGLSFIIHKFEPF